MKNDKGWIIFSDDFVLQLDFFERVKHKKFLLLKSEKKMKTINVQEIESKIKQIICSHFKVETVKDETRLIDDLCGTSIDEMEITTIIEKELGVDLYDDLEVPRIKTVKHFVDFVIKVMTKE